MKSFLLSLLLFGASFFLHAADSIGTVIALDGKAMANERKLSRGASIFLSDLIDVAAKSKLQIKFSDGGLLNLIELTQYRVNTYQFTNSAKDEFSGELVKGGFRALSGSIGGSNPEGYSMKTPVATIGVRGTVFEANTPSAQGGDTFFGCDKGSIVIKTSGGSRELHEGEFVAVDVNGTIGTVTDVRPAALSADVLASPARGEAMGVPMTNSSGDSEQLSLPPSQGNPSCK